MSIENLLVPNNYGVYLGASRPQVGDPVVIGTNASANGGTGCTSIGLSSEAGGVASVSLGGAANGANATALGAVTVASAAGAVAVGSGASAGAINAVSLGTSSQCGPAAVNSTCLGAFAITSASNDISLGYRAGETDPAGTGLFKIAGLPAPAAAAAKASTHEVPIYINGTLYNFLVSNV